MHLSKVKVPQMCAFYMRFYFVTGPSAYANVQLKSLLFTWKKALLCEWGGFTAKSP